MEGKNLVGRMGRITTGGAVSPGGRELGEVMIDGEAFFALSADSDVGIPDHTQVVVVDYHAPRTVVVTPLG